MTKYQFGRLCCQKLLVFRGVNVEFWRCLGGMNLPPLQRALFKYLFVYLSGDMKRFLFTDFQISASVTENVQQTYYYIASS